MDEGGPVQIPTYSPHQEAEDYRVPLSPSVHLSSEDTEGSSSDNLTEKEERIKSKIARIGAQCWARYRNDHPRACGGAQVPVPEQPFHFQALPAEIRLEILRLLLTGKKNIVQMPVDKSTKDYKRVPVDTRIFAVSSIVKEEAEEVFYRSNTFYVHPPYPDVSSRIQLPLFIQRLAGPESANIKAALRSVHLHVIHAQRPSWEFCGPTGIWEGMETVAIALNRCTQLKRVEVALDVILFLTIGQFEKLLTCLSDIRGVDIIFTKISEHLLDNTGRLRPRYQERMDRFERLTVMIRNPKIVKDTVYN